MQRDWLVDYLVLSYSIRPILAERMPIFRMPREEATELADAIEGFCASTPRFPTIPFAGRPAADADPARDERLYVVARLPRVPHPRRLAAATTARRSPTPATRLKPGWIYTWLKGPQRWRADVRCPDYGLTRRGRAAADGVPGDAAGRPAASGGGGEMKRCASDVLAGRAAPAGRPACAQARRRTVAAAPPPLRRSRCPTSCGMGKATFQHYCQTCHGETGAGDGFNAFNLDPHPRDLSRPGVPEEEERRRPDRRDPARRRGSRTLPADAAVGPHPLGQGGRPGAPVRTVAEEDGGLSASAPVGRRRGPSPRRGGRRGSSALARPAF